MHHYDKKLMMTHQRNEVKMKQVWLNLIFHLFIYLFSFEEKNLQAA